MIPPIGRGGKSLGIGALAAGARYSRHPANLGTGPEVLSAAPGVHSCSA
jgi:hypothetical protein